MRCQNIPFRTIFLISLLAFFNSELLARPTTAIEAEKAVIGWLQLDANPLGVSLGNQVSKVETFTDESHQPIYHIVYLEPTGFVIVAADDLIEPIVGFVNGRSFDASENNPLGALVNRDLRTRVTAFREDYSALPEAGKKAANKAQNKWEELAASAESPNGPIILGLTSISDMRVDFFVQSKWSQTTCCDDPNLACYNYYTPQTDTISVIWIPGDPNNYPCGCVATAMSQVMRYHIHPTGPIAGTSYTITADGINDTVFVRGGDGFGGPYNWAWMVYEPNCSTSLNERQAIGSLCYDTGISVQMSYTAGGSSALMTNADASFVTQFNYSNSIYGFNVLPGLINMINPNLDYSHPVMLSLIGTQPEHAVVVDGYGYNGSTMYHHINMGWAGLHDAWYHFCTDMPPGYSSVLESIYNIFVTGGGEIISGRVTDAYGNPLSGETVKAKMTGGGTYQAVTNSRGIYALAHVPSSSNYTVSVTKAGYSFSDQIVDTGTSIDTAPAAGNVWGVDFTPFAGSGSNIYVDANATGNNDGTSWTNAFNYLQDALSAASSGDQILVAASTYKPDESTADPNGTDNRMDTFQLITGVIIYGGFPQGGCNSWNERDIDTYQTILTGDIGTEEDNSDNSYHIVTGSGTDRTAVLDGFTIKHGNANGSHPEDRGAGMYNDTGSPTVKNCIFTNHSAQSEGGGMANFYLSKPDVVNCTFTDSHSGIWNRDTSNARVTNCDFIDNSNYGMFNSYSDPTITGCLFQDNPDSGIINSNSRAKIVKCVFIGNSARFGGAIYFRERNPKVINCIFVGNTADDYGGAIFNRETRPITIVNCIFSGNSAGERGGAIYNYYGNKAQISNCTFVGNSSGGFGGGMYNSGMDPNIVNCILWDNNDTSGNIESAQIYNESCNPTVAYSCIQDDDPNDSNIPYGGGDPNNNIDDNPRIVDPNGGDGIIGTMDDNLHLSYTSPCIDSGNNDAVPEDLADLDGDTDITEQTPFDLDTHPRLWDGKCDDTYIVDMGAYEFAWVYIGDLDGDCDVDFLDFGVLANHWLASKE